MNKKYVKPEITLFNVGMAQMLCLSKWGEKEEGTDIKIQPGSDGSELDAKDNNFGWDDEW